MAFEFPRWTEEDVRQHLSGDLGRALDGARRTARAYEWRLPAKAGEIQNQAIIAQPDGSWELVELQRS